MGRKSKFQSLTIRDDFMFAAVMMKDDNCKRFLEMLLGISIKEIVVNKGKEINYHSDFRGIRLDVFANDENNTRYDIEMQIARQELGKRIRYYHSQMDMELLEIGARYKELPAAYVIFICDFDPFNMGKYCYTFENRCIEDLGLRLGDESTSIVLSTKGKNDEYVPESIKKFLAFVREDNAENNSTTDDEYVHQLQKSIRSIKEDREMEGQYMTKWAWKAYLEDLQDEYMAEGLAEGKLEGKRESIIDILSSFGDVPKHIRDIVIAENRSNILQSMVKIAAQSTSFSDFEEKISNL